MAGKKPKGKRKRSSAFKFVGAILAIFAVFVVVNVLFQFRTYIELKSQMDELESKIETEQKKKEEYNNQMDYYTTDEYIEKIAREQLGLVMPDEMVFKIDKN